MNLWSDPAEPLCSGCIKWRGRLREEQKEQDKDQPKVTPGVYDVLNSGPLPLSSMCFDGQGHPVYLWAEAVLLFSTCSVMLVTWRESIKCWCVLFALYFKRFYICFQYASHLFFLYWIVPINLTVYTKARGSREKKGKVCILHLCMTARYNTVFTV